MLADNNEERTPNDKIPDLKKYLAEQADRTLEAHDVDFAHGNGPLVCGTGEALLLALSGRPAVLDDLDGDGLATLRARVRA